MTRRELIDELRDTDYSIADLESALEKLVYQDADADSIEELQKEIRELEEKYQKLQKELGQ
ncbi:MAG: hypothetical protein WC942_09020 [Clostridia bacterium]|jgi:DNA-binding transcriptional MerR regulator